MKFTFNHNNFNVLDLEKSVEFYKKALGLTVTDEHTAEDGSFKLIFLGDGTTPHRLELTWLRDMDRPYELGDNESHLAMYVDDMEAALAFHREMDCVCFENADMGIYFINDPDGYWIEICPAK
ncbi:MAG: VOC family protein [Lachnospiraceae bacterium]|nr:VOC family protein [Lachnospiraceae bacterium]